MLPDIITNVLNTMISNGSIPTHYNFDISEPHLLEYMKLYSLIKTDTVSINTKTKNNFRYARKLAGINLIKYKLNLGAKASHIKEGLVYTIKNSAWKNHLKIGITTNLDKRVSSYQTYSPFRDYKVEGYEFVFNKREVEKSVLKCFKHNLEQGEWLVNTEANLIMEYVRNNYV